MWVDADGLFEMLLYGVTRKIVYKTPDGGVPITTDIEDRLSSDLKDVFAGFRVKFYEERSAAGVALVVALVTAACVLCERAPYPSLAVRTVIMQ